MFLLLKFTSRISLVLYSVYTVTLPPHHMFFLVWGKKVALSRLGDDHPPLFGGFRSILAVSALLF